MVSLKGVTKTRRPAEIVSRRLAKHWGRMIAGRRTTLGMSQGELAGRLRTSQTTVSRYEIGRTLPADAVKVLVACSLGLTPGDLFPWPALEDLLEDLPWDEGSAA